MELFTNSLTQLRSLWARWSLAQRAGIVVALAFSVLAITGVGYWAAQAEYVTLADRLSPQQAAEVISVLESERIPYQLNFAGSSVSVPIDKLSRGRIALKDVLVTTADDVPELSDGIWSDPALHQVRMTRQLEQRLSRSISQLSSVREATVHLTPGQTSPFIRDRQPAKASVILDLQPGALFTAAEAQSITSLLAHSVEDLTAEAVSVMDTSGRLLSTAQGMEADVNGQLAYRNQVESGLSAKAEAILNQMLGPGRAVVRVTADIDFTKTQRTEIRYDPDANVKVSETIHSESMSGGSKPASAGAAGTASNLDPLAFKSGNSSSTNKVESNTTTYENAKTEDTIQEVPGRIRRLTVAAVVQLKDKAASGADAATGDAQTAADTPTITQQQVEEIIKQAVGFDAARSDEIKVLIAPLAGNLAITPVPTGTTGWREYTPLLKNISLGLAAIVALLLGLLVIRRMQPIVVETERKETLSPEMVLRIADLSRQARENPDAVASVVEAWLNQDEAQQSQTRQAA